MEALKSWQLELIREFRTSVILYRHTDPASDFHKHHRENVKFMLGETLFEHFKPILERKEDISSCSEIPDN